MRAVLMHKNIEVSVVRYEGGKITEVEEILNTKHMPVGTWLPTMTNDLCCVYLQAWQRSRAIPNDRTNIAMVLEASGKDVFQLGALGHGMGLTDQYWVRGTKEKLIWEQINFHRNGFQISPLTLIGKGDVVASPDYETNGALPKAWILLDKIPTLLKDSPDWLPTASANEVVASQLAQMCGVSHAIYYPIFVGNKPLCATPCFVGSDREEFVSLLQFMRTYRGEGKETALQMGLNQNFIDTMTAFDLMIGNTDRHEGNLGAIINPDTMEFIRPAPLFDSGTSLHQWRGENLSFKPFYPTKEKAQESLSGIPLSLPQNTAVQSIIVETYRQFGVEEYAQSAVDELLRNTDQLEMQMEHSKLMRQLSEDDLCL